MKPHFWVALLSTLLLVAQPLTSANGSHDVTPPKPLFQTSLTTVFLDILNGPLKDQTLFISYDEEASQAVDIDYVLSEAQAPTFLVKPKEMERNANETEYQEGPVDFLPPRGVQEGRCVAVLLVSSPPGWIHNFDEFWYFTSIVIITTNASYNVELLIEEEIIQRSRNILIIKEDAHVQNKSYVYVYSSKPFYKPDSNQKINLGMWNKNSFQNFSSLFPDRFINFQGETIHISSDVDDFPLVIENDDGSAGGMNIEIVKALGEWLNFNYTTTIEAEDLLWGELENGTWSGLFGQVQHGGKNFTLNYLTITLERLQYFDSSVPYMWEGFGFAIKTPPPLPASRNLVTPFSWQVCYLVTSLDTLTK